MKVAIFTDTFFPQVNGVTNTLNKLIEYYISNGIEYKIFVPKYDMKEADNIFTERFYSIKFLFYPESRITIPNTIRITSLLSEFKPDIIHLMTEFSMGLSGLNYGKKHGIPTISNYTTNFSQYTDYYKIHFLKQPIWNYLKWFHSQNDITLCPSTASQELLDYHGISNTKIFSRGIDYNNFNPIHRNNTLRDELGITGKIAFLYVGRVSCEKDLDTLSISYKEILKKYKDKVAMVITGDGPYMAKAKQIFPKDTLFTGIKRGKELSEIYASCDIFVCPSSTETFGNVVLEAMASGIAVIGADAGGVGEIITDGVNGLKFSSKNEEELSNCMTKLIQDIELRNNLRINAREYSLTRSWDTICDGLNNIYHTTIEKRKVQIIGA